MSSQKALSVFVALLVALVSLTSVGMVAAQDAGTTIETKTVSINDSANETIVSDSVFDGTDNVTVEVRLEQNDTDGTLVDNKTISYTGGSGTVMETVYWDASESGQNLTDNTDYNVVYNIESGAAASHDKNYIEVTTDDVGAAVGGVFGGSSNMMLLAGLGVVALIGLMLREMDNDGY